MGNKKGQITIFIIIAVLIVASIAAFFIFRDGGAIQVIPSSIEPIYTSFLSCLEDKTKVGINLLESQAGYIDVPAFEPGSSYMPFSNHLNFLGNSVPYWYYVSGNNIQREQIPTKSEMQIQLANFIDDKIKLCNLESYRSQGFKINVGEPKSQVVINDNSVNVQLDMSLNINRGEDISSIRSHKVELKSNLGKLYKSAKSVYDYEQKNLFLENYGVDTLRLYAPVEGVELTCSPKTWNANDLFKNLQNAIEANTLALKVKTGDYSLKKKENEYFVVDIPGITENVRFLNSKNWANSFEVNPSDDGVLIAKPIGTQPGLGALGFCYVPYHFVYDVKYPVLIQIYSGEEIFQFPVAVVIRGNKPRVPFDTNAFDSVSSGICENKNTFMNVKTYDTQLKPIDAEISYRCFDEICDIGKTTSGVLETAFPQCANGFIVAREEGYIEAKRQVSTTASGSAEIILDKLYDLNVELNLDGKQYSSDAIISFISEKYSTTIIYPEQKSVKLSGGQYEVQVYVYKNSSITLAETNQEQCIDVQKSGIGGILGMTEKKCFDITIPSQFVSNILSGGGKENYYILESELSKSKNLEINAQSIPTPKNIEELQQSYIIFENKGLNINFK